MLLFMISFFLVINSPLLNPAALFGTISNLSTIAPWYTWTPTWRHTWSKSLLWSCAVPRSAWLQTFSLRSPPSFYTWSSEPCFQTGWESLSDQTADMDRKKKTNVRWFPTVNIEYFRIPILREPRTDGRASPKRNVSIDSFMQVPIWGKISKQSYGIPIRCHVFPQIIPPKNHKQLLAWF